MYTHINVPCLSSKDVFFPDITNIINTIFRKVHRSLHKQGKGFHTYQTSRTKLIQIIFQERASVIIGKTKRGLTEFE